MINRKDGDFRGVVVSAKLYMCKGLCGKHCWASYGFCVVLAELKFLRLNLKFVVCLFPFICHL